MLWTSYFTRIKAKTPGESEAYKFSDIIVAKGFIDKFSVCINDKFLRNIYDIQTLPKIHSEQSAKSLLFISFMVIYTFGDREIKELSRLGLTWLSRFQPGVGPRSIAGMPVPGDDKYDLIFGPNVNIEESAKELAAIKMDERSVQFGALARMEDFKYEVMVQKIDQNNPEEPRVWRESW